MKFKNLFLFLILFIVMIFAFGCAQQQKIEASAEEKTPTSEINQQSSERDDFGCFSSCKYFPEGSPRQMCEDWKAGKQVKWPDCSYMSEFPACFKLCEFEKTKQTTTFIDPNSPQFQPNAGFDSFVISLKEVPPACITDSEDQRAQLVYARPQDASDRYDEMAPKMRKWIAQGNSIINDEAKRFNVNANLKMACEGGKLTVLNAVLSTASSKKANVDILTAELRSKGFKDDKVKYIVWYDGKVTEPDGSPGSKAEAWLNEWPDGTSFGKPQDDRPTVDNVFNKGGDFSFTYQLFEKDFVQIAMLHEYTHTMGFLQSSAPHHNGFDGHCNDSKPVGQGGQDMNCGSNSRRGNLNPVFGDACPGYGFRYDCGNDDYFNPKPEPGSYLATHWNLGLPMNKFIKFGK